MVSDHHNQKAPVLLASVYAADPLNLRHGVQQVFDAGLRHFHIDIMDGVFVPALGLRFSVITALKAAFPQAHFQAHLMTVSPELHLNEVLQAGADSIIIHVEATPHPYRLLQTIRASGVDAGIALNPGTPINSLYSLVGLCDYVLVMTTNPGHPGEVFIEAMLPKIQALRRRFPTLRIVADGNINLDNILDVRSAGVDWFVCGRSIFNDDPRHSIGALSGRLHQAATRQQSDGKRHEN